MTSIPSRADDLVTNEIAKEALNFSAGHVTMFSATEREDLHGHNWRVACEITARRRRWSCRLQHHQAASQGDHRYARREGAAAGCGAWLRIERGGEWLIAHFDQEHTVPAARRGFWKSQCQRRGTR